MIPYTKEAYQLLHDGAIALGQVESNGIRVDTEYLDTTIRRLRRRIDHLREKIQSSEVMKKWKAYYKGRSNLNSNEQLGYVLFELMGYHCPNMTETGRFKTDEETLSAVDNPFVGQYLKIQKLQKSMGTYLMGIKREVVDGFIHPFFNLHLVRTFRSSADSPNFQNIPIRDPEISRLIRQAFIPRPGHRLVELDYSGIEVAVAACYHKDPTMLSYLKDPTKDMHRDAAMSCYKLPIEEMTPGDDTAEQHRVKDIRYCGKNQFVFPEFYGDWYLDCARSLWESVRTMNLRTKDGRSLYEHLRRNGVKELGTLDPREKPRPGTMEYHIQQVEKHFWGERFPTYAKWKKEWVNLYQKRGWMKTLTGFICQGPLKRNEIVNYPVQGSAFHCLLRSIIHLQRRLKKERMRTLIVGQIHDSAVNDVPEEELEDFLGIAQEVMVEGLKRAWDWIITPIEIEAEVTPVDGNWFQKEEWRMVG